MPQNILTVLSGTQMMSVGLENAFVLPLLGYILLLTTL
jgi:hypothetical protein